MKIAEENATEELKFLATMEEVHAVIEENNFDNLDDTRQELPQNYPVDGSVDLNERIAFLIAEGEMKIGPSIVTQVRSGQKVQASVEYFYEEDAPGAAYDNLGFFVDEILVSLASSAAGVVGMTDGQLIDIASGNTPIGGQLYQLLSNSIDTTDMSRPHGYLVYASYDDRGNLLLDKSGARQVSEPNQLRTILTNEITARHNGFMHIYVSNGSSNRGISFDQFMVTIQKGKTRQFNDYYPYGLPIADIHENLNRYLNKYTSKEHQTGEYMSRGIDQRGLEMFDFHARFFDPQLARWHAPDPAMQFSNPYLGIGNNPVMYVDPDGEFAILPILLVAKKIAVAAKATAKVAATVAKVGAQFAVKGAKFAAKKSFKGKYLKANLKSGTINTISNYDGKEGLGVHTLGDFAAGFVGSAAGAMSGSKLIGMGVGGFATMGVRNSSFDYQGAQEFVGGALSTYVGMGKAVPGKFSLFQGQEFAGKSLFKMEKSSFINKTLKVHGDKFISKGLQNSAFDFAYTPEDEFRKRQGGHAELFAWGGLVGSYSTLSFAQPNSSIGQSLILPVVEWYGNGFIKKRYKSVKRNKSQVNKGIIGFYKWFNTIKHQ